MVLEPGVVRDPRHGVALPLGRGAVPRGRVRRRGRREVVLVQRPEISGVEGLLRERAEVVQQGRGKAPEGIALAEGHLVPHVLRHRHVGQRPVAPQPVLALAATPNRCGGRRGARGRLRPRAEGAVGGQAAAPRALLRRRARPLVHRLLAERELALGGGQRGGRHVAVPRRHGRGDGGLLVRRARRAGPREAARRRAAVLVRVGQRHRRG
mmetsp:Transcript_6025/g.20252  ORF Transcript_6025/g.20252 Transcript_6025/m.20252 type:complete len:210 (+) Transcript_6025:301-930(+)